MKTITVPIIKSEEDLKVTLKMFERVFLADSGTPEADEREILALLIEAYERKHFPIEAPDPVSAILFAIEQRNFDKKHVATILGGASRLSEILSGKRGLSLQQIRALHSTLSIPLESLIAAASTKASGKATYRLKLKKIPPSRQEFSAYDQSLGPKSRRTPQKSKRD